MQIMKLTILFLCPQVFAYMGALTSFTTGQVSPFLEARADYQKYNSSCRTLENMLVTVQGPVLKRPGTKYIATANAGIVRLLPFEYSTDDAYVLEAGNLYMRFYRDGGQILDPVNPVQIVTVYDTDEVWDIQYAQTDNEMYLVDGTDVPQILNRTSHTAWLINDVDFQTGPFLSENDTETTIAADDTTGTVTLTASTGIFRSAAGASHVGSIWQINQVGGNPSVTGSFTANGVSISTSFFTGGYAFTTDGNADGTITLQRSTNGGISWRNALAPLTDTDFDNPAEIEEDGAIYRAVMSAYGSGTATYNITITDNVNRGVVKITAVATAFSATAEVLNTLVSTSATTSWREGYWSDYRGWPKTVAFHQQRLVFAGSDTYPQTIWFGKQDPDDYANFLEGSLDTSAFTVALEGQNPIRWLLSRDYLLIGTSGSCGKWGEQGKAVTPTTPNYQEQTPYGSAAFQALRGGDDVLYVERGARKVRQFGYNFQTDRYLAPELTTLSPEITESGITDIAFQLRPTPIMWCVLDNGDIATLTYQRDQSVIAWTKQITDGDFESVVVVSSGDDEDEVWVSVNRNDTRYIEQFQPIDWGTDQEDAWFVDSGLDYDSDATATFGGLDHLDDETVAVWADGIVQESEIVVTGSITIDVASSRVIAGLPFTAKLETLPIRIDPQDYAMNKKIKRLWIDFYETGDVEFGNGANSTLTWVNFWDGATVTAYQDLYTSTATLKQFPFIYARMMKQTVYLQSSKPVPLSVRAIIAELDPKK